MGAIFAPLRNFLNLKINICFSSVGTKNFNNNKTCIFYENLNVKDLYVKYLVVKFGKNALGASDHEKK